MNDDKSGETIRQKLSFPIRGAVILLYWAGPIVAFSMHFPKAIAAFTVVWTLFVLFCPLGVAIDNGLERVGI